MDFVLKVKYEDEFRRLMVRRRKEHCANACDAVDLSYAGLQENIRTSFGIPPSSTLIITYQDIDKDFITISGIEEVKDALVNQRLSPLRLDVKTVDKELAAIVKFGQHIAAPRSLMQLSKSSELQTNFSSENESTLMILHYVAKVVHNLLAVQQWLDLDLPQKGDRDIECSPGVRQSAVQVNQLRHKLHEVILLTDLILQTSM